MVRRLNAGGATAGFSYSVCLNDGTEDETCVWQSYRVRPIYVFWVDASKLEVVVSEDDRDYWHWIRVAEPAGLSLWSLVAKGSSKSAVIDAKRYRGVPR